MFHQIIKPIRTCIYIQNQFNSDYNGTILHKIKFTYT